MQTHEPMTAIQGMIMVASLWGVFIGLAYCNWLLVLPALRSGVLQARGRTYSYWHQKKRFLLGIIFWIFLLCMIGFVTVFVTFMTLREIM